MHNTQTGYRECSNAKLDYFFINFLKKNARVSKEFLISKYLFQISSLPRSLKEVLCFSFTSRHHSLHVELNRKISFNSYRWTAVAQDSRVWSWRLDHFGFCGFEDRRARSGPRKKEGHRCCCHKRLPQWRIERLTFASILTSLADSIDWTLNRCRSDLGSS